MISQLPWQQAIVRPGPAGKRHLPDKLRSLGSRVVQTHPMGRWQRIGFMAAVEGRKKKWGFRRHGGLNRVVAARARPHHALHRQRDTEFRVAVATVEKQYICRACRSLHGGLGRSAGALWKICPGLISTDLKSKLTPVHKNHANSDDSEVVKISEL